MQASWLHGNAITHARPFVGVFKSQFTTNLSIFDNNFPQNGSKNEETAPRMRTGCPHEGPSVGYMVAMGGTVFMALGFGRERERGGRERHERERGREEVTSPSPSMRPYTRLYLGGGQVVTNTSRKERPWACFGKERCLSSQCASLSSGHAPPAEKRG